MSHVDDRITADFELCLAGAVSHSPLRLHSLSRIEIRLIGTSLDPRLRDCARALAVIFQRPSLPSSASSHAMTALYDAQYPVRYDVHQAAGWKLQEYAGHADIKYMAQFSKLDGLQPDIPAESLFEHTSKDTSAGFPSIADCAIHLELLECFYALKVRVTYNENIRQALGAAPIRLAVSKEEEKRQDMWDKYVDFAVVRFLQWKEVVNKMGIKEIDYENLPPPDVLLVWHSFLLNPEMFRYECHSEPFYELRIPWNAVHRMIRNDDWAFYQPFSAAANWHHRIGLTWDLLVQMEEWEKRRKSEINVPALKLRDFDWYRGTVPTRVYETNFSEISDKIMGLFQKARETNKDLAKELKEAVIRQVKFTDKMDKRMWIRSPYVTSTLQRSIDRYGQFLHLFKDPANHYIVPTNDIDLVWHTHQCAGAKYADDMRTIVGRFINHNDKVGEKHLSNGWDKTRTLWRITYGSEYQVCGCWECEALTTEMERIQDMKEEDIDMKKIADHLELKIGYYRGNEIARRKKQKMRQPYSLDLVDENYCILWKKEA